MRRLGALALALPLGLFAQAAPPLAPVHDTTIVYFGHSVVDPYQWMERPDSPDLKRWLSDQAAYANAYLARLPLRDSILARVKALTLASAEVGFDIQSHGGRWFYTRRAADEQNANLYVRDQRTGAERLLVDPMKVLADGKRYSIAAWSVSFDGNHVSYLIASGGGEYGQLRVADVRTGRDLGESIDRMLEGAGAWMPDGKSFLYTRLQPFTSAMAPTERKQKQRIYLHRLGGDPAGDIAVFGYGVDPKVDLDPAFVPEARTDPAWSSVIVVSQPGVPPANEFYAAPVSSVGRSSVPWRQLAGLGDRVAKVALHGDALYLMTFQDAPRYKIIRTSLSKPDISKARTVFAPTEAVTTALIATHDALYVGTLEGGDRRIYRVDYTTGAAAPLPLPYQGAAYLALTESRLDGINFSLVSWTHPAASYHYDPRTGASVETHLLPGSPIDMSGYEFVNVNATSHDGAMIPMVIIYKKGLKRDGTNPALMLGYGAYGVEITSPFFDPAELPWLERGGVFVWAGVRGGGEYGEAWHRGGLQATKPNSWKDFIACAELLSAQGYTSAAHLGIKSGSAGGILISNVVAERPDVIGAAVDESGVNDALRFETTSNGVLNIPEFGSTKTEAGFAALLAMDGYLKIQNGVKYPAVLFAHGINDPRVEPWMSAKMAARLQAATASGKPVLMRVDYDAGHGRGSTQAQVDLLQADEFAFLFDQLGASRPP